MIDQALGLPQEDGHHFVAHLRIVDDDEIPALHIGAGRRPAPALDDALQHIAVNVACRPRISARYGGVE